MKRRERGREPHKREPHKKEHAPATGRPTTRQRQSRRVGQSGVEFLAVTGIGLLLIVGVSVFLLGEGRTRQDDTRVEQATSVQRMILEQAQDVWSLGRNSWLTADVTLPEGTRDVLIVDDTTLLVIIETTQGRTAVPTFSELPLAGATLLGDANSDGVVTGADQARIDAAIAGTVTLSAKETKAADVNSDGVVDEHDSTLVGEYLAGREAPLPAQSAFASTVRVGLVSFKVTNNGTAVVIAVQ